MPGRKISVLLTLLGLTLFFASDARAQIKTERAYTSNFAKVWWSHAEEITTETVPAPITQMLKKVVADAGQGRFKQYDTEVMVWRGAPFKKRGAASIIKSLKGQFEKAEYRYQEGETVEGVTPFRIDEDADGRIVVGFYLVTQDGLLWAWSQVYE